LDIHEDHVGLEPGGLVDCYRAIGCFTCDLNSVGGFEDALLATMLGSAGLQPGDVELVNINFALSQSLLAGSVDAVIGAYRNYELNILALQNRPALPFFVEDYGVPAYDELIQDRGIGSTEVGRPLLSLSCELVLLSGRPCDQPGCAASADP